MLGAIFEHHGVGALLLTSKLENKMEAPLPPFSTTNISTFYDENNQAPTGVYEDNSYLWVALNTLFFPLTCCWSCEQLKPEYIGVVSKFSRPVKILDEPGNHFLPPIGTNVVKVYVGENHLEINSLNVKDSNATSIIVSANLIYKVSNVMEILSRQNYERYLNDTDRMMGTYARSAIQEVATRFPYDSSAENPTAKVANACSSNDLQTINADLLDNVKKRAIDSGMEVLSFKITSAYVKNRT